MPNEQDQYRDPRPPGLYVPNSFQCPNEVVDELLPELSGSELKVLLYIVRRTFGFQKESDNISLSQMLYGIVKHDGTQLDRGVGIKDKKTLLAALRSLEEKGFIYTERRQSLERGNEPTSYQLNLINFSVQGRTPLPLEEKSPQGGGGKIPPSPRGENPPTQNLVLQNPVKQNINLSNIRKAKSSFDYVNSSQPADDGKSDTVSQAEIGEELQQSRGRGRPRKQEGTVQTPKLVQHHRNIETSTTEKSSLPARARQEQFSQFESVGDTLASRYSQYNASDDDEAYDAIRDYIRDIAGKLHDEAPLKSSTTRAYKLYVQSGVDLNRFFNLLYDAEKEASRRSGSIKKLTEQGFKNRMAYFFAILEDLLGLRPPQQSSTG